MFYLILSYAIYLAMTISLTIWVAQTLFRNGRVFLIEIFHGDETLANSVNKLLLTGFYLINIGYAVYVLRIGQQVANWKDVFEQLSKKVGLIILILGAMHFFNLYVFFKLRNRVKEQLKRPAPLVASNVDPQIF